MTKIFKDEAHFAGTPSFFKDVEAFAYLGLSSYYLALQQNIEKIIGFLQPKQVLELGSALGNTSIRYARKFPEIQFEGFDMRTDVVEYANEYRTKAGLNNLLFQVKDMQEIAHYPLYTDFIFMLYSFHHIPDPEQNKVLFLRNMHEHMREGSYLCIAETFLPNEAVKLHETDAIRNLWEERSREGYASTFWNVLDGISEQSIQKAHKAGIFSKEQESLAGKLVSERNEEYLVTNHWLIEKVQENGFQVILNEPVNALSEYIIILRK